MTPKYHASTIQKKQYRPVEAAAQVLGGPEQEHGGGDGAFMDHHP